MLCFAQLCPIAPHGTPLQYIAMECAKKYSATQWCTTPYTTLHYNTPHHTTPIIIHTTLHWTNAEANDHVIASVNASRAMAHARVDALADIQG